MKQGFKNKQGNILNNEKCKEWTKKLKIQSKMQTKGNNKKREKNKNKESVCFNMQLTILKKKKDKTETLQ